MSDTHLPISSTDDLQFATAEPIDSSAAAEQGLCCAACQQPIGDVYYALGDQPICPECREAGLAAPTGGGLGRLVKATAMGLAAGLAGAFIWYVIRRVTNLEIGLVAVLVGVMVGGAVRKGSGGRGGRGYQVLAVLMAYGCISASFFPDVLQALFNPPVGQQAVAAGQPLPVEAGKPLAAEVGADGNGAVGNGPVDKGAVDNGAVGNGAAVAAAPKIGPLEMVTAIVIISLVAVVASLAAPVVSVFGNIILLPIFGFALWEAWKINARRPPPISGPYRIGAAPAA